MTHYRCCPECGGAADDCCEWQELCDFTQPTQIEVSVELYCTAEVYIDGVLHSTFVTEDTVSTYTVTNFTTTTVTTVCGTYDVYDSTDINFTQTGSRISTDFAIGPENNNSECFVPGGCTDNVNNYPCDNCGLLCTCEFTDWRFCVQEETINHTSAPTGFVNYGCYTLDGCFRPGIYFNFDPDLQSIAGGTGTVDQIDCCDNTGFPYNTTPSFTHKDLLLIGACGCPGPKAWQNLTIADFANFGGGGVPSWTGSNTQTFCTDDVFSPAIDLIAGCNCTDLSVSPPVYNVRTCAQAQMTRIVKCCTYTITVTIT